MQWYADLDSQALRKHYGLIIFLEYAWYSQRYFMCSIYMSNTMLMEGILFVRNHSLCIMFQVYSFCHHFSSIHTFHGLLALLDFFMESAYFSHNLSPSTMYMQHFCLFSNMASTKNPIETLKDIGFQDFVWTLFGFSPFFYWLATVQITCHFKDFSFDVKNQSKKEDKIWWSFVLFNNLKI